ncbi:MULTISPECIES: GrpB family protein [unclassified Rhizobium]|uniref:GrpB family protein n=1 Tax=unclassified Rhizobium TaxID=2613769 RepID=UPI001ADB9DA6|nr:MULTISPECIES: GrpB family protein [unclassified Rhizobium]MBO9124708.1 GrpB family protein [Rhizobium sp. 16-488-2b]MBO9175292.1 GrpB family protein [Rhizobium sp. 16-488-2a]
MPERVEIVPYDAAWPAHFREIAAALKTLLGDHVLDIHHIGSTSIPGIAAKPLIDIDVILPNAADVIDACPLMEAIGYEPRGNRYDADIFAFMKRITTPKQRVYLCPEGHDTHHRRILFRDYLRTHPQAAADYQALKLKLAEDFEYDGDGYTAAKAAFVNDIVAHASKR